MRERGEQDVPPVQGVAHRELREDSRLPVFCDLAGEEDAAVADVPHDPLAVGGEEGEGEIGERPERRGEAAGLG